MLILTWCFLASLMGCSCLERPNIVLMVADDLGYGDLSSYGHPTQEWGAIDDLASNGVRFTQVYAAASFCTPSRASLLTGRLPIRSGMYGSLFVLYPGSAVGLPHEEVTLAEVVKPAGYRTGFVGKWHLGMNAHNHSDGSFLPHTQGFDYVGSLLPYTLNWLCDHWKRHIEQPSTRVSYLYKNNTIVEQPIALDTLTEKLVRDAQTFIHFSVDCGEKFFLYLGFPQTHAPMFNDKRFKGNSRRGVYGDQVNEMAWGVSEIMKTLREKKIEEETLVIFLSDQGPHLEVCQEGGSTGPLKEGKGFFGEGALRVPMIFHWPGVLKPRVESSVVSLMDILPTFAALTGTGPPQDRHLDGKDLSNLLFNKTPSLHDVLYFYHESTLLAVRYGAYKIYFYELQYPSDDELRNNCHGTYPINNWMQGEFAIRKKLNQPKIYNIDEDPREFYFLPIQDHKELLQNVNLLIEKHKETVKDLPAPLLGDDFHSKLVIPCCNYPYCVCK